LPLVIFLASPKTMTEHTVDIDAVFRLGTPIDEAMHDAFLDAVRKHRHAGQPLVVWRNERVEYISADTIADDGTLLDRQTN